MLVFVLGLAFGCVGLEGKGRLNCGGGGGGDGGTREVYTLREIRSVDRVEYMQIIWYVDKHRD